MTSFADNDDFWNTPANSGGGDEKSGLTCPNCASTAIESHPSSGQAICTSCGVVVEENCIVNSVEFAEGAGGSSSVVGQYVSANASKAYTGFRGGSRYGFSVDSRESTLADGRRRIQDCANRLRLGYHFVDSAHRLYTIALEKNFTRGRRKTHVVAACLYAACRQEKSQHMLIDFSDALQANVYALGTCFLKLRRLLGLKLEIVDPALFVYRFASHMELGEEHANAVAMTALRVVGRMKRDWISVGRRPAGICAAALLIAARAHGFSREHQDVTRILRICGMTVCSRLKEFECTPSAGLSLDQFHEVDIETEMDPPVFTSNRYREARALAIRERNVDLLMSGELDDPRLDKKNRDRWRKLERSDKNKDIDLMYEELEREMKGDDDNNNDDEGDQTNIVPQKELVLVEKKNQRSVQAMVMKRDRKVELTDKLSIKYPTNTNHRPVILPNLASKEELQLSMQPEEDKINLREWKSNMPDTTEKEIDNIFRDDDEVAQKEAVFNRMNKDYIERQEQKDSDKNKDGDDNSQQTTGKRKYQRRKKTKTGEDGEEEEMTTEEALMATVSGRKVSRKINYDAMASIFDEDGGFSKELLEDDAGPGIEAGEYHDIFAEV